MIIFAVVMNQAKEEHIEAFERLDEEYGSCFMAEEPSWRGMSDELEELHYLKGAQFVSQLKLTPSGKSSVGTRLIGSIGQSNRVLLNMPPNYNTRLLAADIKKYFETNVNAVEVLIFKGKKCISIDRFVANHPSFYRLLKKRYEK